MRRQLASTVLATSLALSGCGAESSTGDGTGTSTTPPTPTRRDDAQAQLDTFQCPAGATLAEGVNTFTIAGRQRQFHLSLPKNAGDAAVGVVFAWHGFGGSMMDWDGAFPSDGRAGFPLAVVMPDDVGLMPYGNSSPFGLDWDIFESKAADDNLEGALFEAVLGCLKSKVKIDVAHVHSVGFSAGAIATAMLHARYPKLVHTVAVVSGAWFNDKPTVKGVEDNIAASPAAGALSGVTLEWTSLASTEGGAILQTHGGANDTYGVLNYQVIDFEASAGFARTYLRANNRGVVDCAHTSGHTLPSSVSVAGIVDFLQQNPLPETTAPVTLPSSLTAACTLVP